MSLLSDVQALVPRRSRLWAGFVGLFVVGPVVIALAFPPNLMFPLLFGFTALGLVLLHLTPGFEWRSLARGAGRIDWRRVAGFALATIMVGSGALWLTAPGATFFLVWHSLALMLMIAALCPVLSALPQERVFRPLSFRRYGGLLPGGDTAPLVLNAVLFSLAHLMCWSWIATLMTFSGGLIFAWAYERRGNFPEAVMLHSVAGVIVFALGLRAFFYSGNVQQPFQAGARVTRQDQLICVNYS